MSFTILVGGLMQEYTYCDGSIRNFATISQQSNGGDIV